MNFDTKYLIRWGIPGWLFLISLVPLIMIKYIDVLTSDFSNKNLLVLGTFVTLAGVPIGYFFNQLHHLVCWVIPKLFEQGWEEYFRDEIKIDNLLAKEKNGHYKERYRYLLSKKHEVGSVLFSFCGAFLIVFFNLLSNEMSFFEFCYILILLILIIFWRTLRNYASKNVHIYFKKLLEAS